MIQGGVNLIVGRRPSVLHGDRHAPESVIDSSELVVRIVGTRALAPNTVRRGRPARQGGTRSLRTDSLPAEARSALSSTGVHLQVRHRHAEAEAVSAPETGAR